MAEYSRLASGKVSSVLTGAPTTVIIPFIPDFIAIDNVTRMVAGAGVTSARWNVDMGQGAAVLNTFGTGEQYIAPVGGTSSGALVSGTGFSTFKAGLSLQYGPQIQIVSISKAASGVVTTAAAHNLVSGNIVLLTGLYQSATTGMPQLSLMPFVVTVTGATTFTIPYNTNQTNFTALAGSPAGAFVKQILYPILYAPGIAFISSITLGATTTVTTTSPHNFSVGQEVAFRIPSVFGTTQLNSLPNVLIPGSPIYAFVTVVNSATSFVVNVNSTAYTAFNSNQTVLSVPGLSYPQVVAVGDINSGSLFSNFQSPTFYNGSGTAAVQTINGPAIAGAFCNNTNMGFIIGGSISGSTEDVIHWRAYMHDINFP